MIYFDLDGIENLVSIGLTDRRKAFEISPIGGVVDKFLADIR